jgi:hypothetical protein
VPQGHIDDVMWANAAGAVIIRLPGQPRRHEASVRFRGSQSRARNSARLSGYGIAAIE